MSRTKRKGLKGYNPQRLEDNLGDAQIDDWPRNRKMRPYAITPGVNKYKAVKSCYATGFTKGVTKRDKLITRNANRAFKKGFRQQTKQQIKKELNEVGIS